MASRDGRPRPRGSLIGVERAANQGALLAQAPNHRRFSPGSGGARLRPGRHSDTSHAVSLRRDAAIGRLSLVPLAPILGIEFPVDSHRPRSLQPHWLPPVEASSQRHLTDA